MRRKSILTGFDTNCRNTPRSISKLARLPPTEKSGERRHSPLGKFNLYEGKLPLAEHHLHSALRDKALPEKMRAEALELQKKIALLQK
jgi:hypothetical protein